MGEWENREIHEMAQWASQIAEKYNRSITYVIMKIHEANAACRGIECVKDYVMNELGGE